MKKHLKTMQNSRVLCMTQIALFTAVMAILSQAALPLPSNVPLTLQTFAVTLCAFLGGIRKGLPACLLYLALGAVGVPVFSGFRGGMGVLLGFTGGFLWGFIPLVCCCAVGAALQNKAALICCTVLGLLLCHSFGILQYAYVSGAGLMQSFLLVSVPYLLKDVISAAVGFRAAMTVQHALQNAGLHKE